MKAEELSKVAKNRVTLSKKIHLINKLNAFNFKQEILHILTIAVRAYGMRCAIWYHLYNLKNVKNTHGGVLILIKLQVPNRATHHINAFTDYLSKKEEILL